MKRSKAKEYLAAIASIGTLSGNVDASQFDGSYGVQSGGYLDGSEQRKEDTPRASQAVSRSLATGEGEVDFSKGMYVTYEGAGELGVWVARSGCGSSGDGGGSVGVMTLDGTALAGYDFAHTEQVVSWGPGDCSSRRVPVSIIDDHEYEKKIESAYLKLVGAQGVQIGSSGGAEFIIWDNDFPAESCLGNTVVMENRYVGSGDWINCEGAVSLEVHNSHVGSSGGMNLSSDRAVIRPPFGVERGGYFIVSAVSTPTEKASRSFFRDEADEGAFRSLRRDSVVNGPPSRSMKNSNDRTVRADQIALEDSSIYPNSRSKVIFATEKSLMRQDKNGMSDVYLYDLFGKNLSLVSKGDAGYALNGESRGGYVDPEERYAVFEFREREFGAELASSSRIGVYSIEAQKLDLIDARVAGIEYGPVIDSRGENILFDNELSEGVNAVTHLKKIDGMWRAREWLYDEGGEGAQVIPAVSADGLYAAVLVIPDDSFGNPVVWVVDMGSNRQIQVSYHGETPTTIREIRGGFSKDGSHVIWKNYSGNQGTGESWIPNPFLY